MRALLLALVLLAAAPGDFWSTPRQGASWFNLEPRREWLVWAREAGLEVVRMAPSKWPGAGRDFLIGDADRFEGIPPGDLALLKRSLDEAAEVGVKVVVVPLSLPGARWKQHNEDRLDSRLWTDESYLPQAEAFWTELATALRGHPAVAAYDLLNEPVPERATGPMPRDLASWHERVRGTPADINLFNRRMVAAIRRVDPSTTIVVEPGVWAGPQSFPFLEPLDDPRVLYSFHFYEPEVFVDWRTNRGSVRYPSAGLDRGSLAGMLAPIAEWQERHGIPSRQVFAAEFGCHRTLPGAAEWLADVASLIDERGWHRAFYSFREDEWDGMNYELGAEPIRAPLREALREGAPPPESLRDNPLWRAVRPGGRRPR